MIHPSTKLEFISELKGFGVVATEFIPRGTITWVQDKLDRVFSEDDLIGFEKEYLDIIETYSFRNQSGNYVLCWDHGRFVNHSFISNCITTPYNFEIAIRDIYPGEELTDDYGYLNVSEPFDAIDEGAERTTVYPDDLVRLHGYWDEIIADIFPLIRGVEQPLHSFLGPQERKSMEKVLAGEKQLDSILTCFYEQK